MSEDKFERQLAMSSDPLGLNELGDAWRRLVSWWEANRQTIADAVLWASSSYVMAEKLSRTGWLPHYTTPDLALELDDDASDALIGNHYEANWDEVERAFITRLDGYRIDEEAKACFREALAAHRMKLYRVAPRLLFPEIERVSRAQLGGVITINASLRWLRESADRLGGDTFIRTGVLTLRLYEAFAERIYSQVHTDDELASAASDSIPYRNAAIHGLVVYNSQKASLNALIIAEYVLLTVSAVRQQTLGGYVDHQSAAADASLPAPRLHVAGNRDWRRFGRGDPRPVTGGDDRGNC